MARGNPLARPWSVIRTPGCSQCMANPLLTMSRSRTIDKSPMINKGVARTLLVIIAFLMIEGSIFAADVSCRYCGMPKALYGHSWVVIYHDDSSVGEFCSLHCASIDMALNTDRTPRAILVGDYYSKKLIDADRAYWVVGGTKMGVMTTRAKWAFERRQYAERFMAEYGGETATFDTAMKAAFEDMYLDILMIQKRRTLMRWWNMKANTTSK